MKRIIHIDPSDYGYDHTRKSCDPHFNTTTGVFTGTIYNAKRGTVINDPMTCNHILIENTDNMYVYRMNGNGSNMLSNMINNYTYSKNGIYIPVIEGTNNVFIYAIAFRALNSDSNTGTIKNGVIMLDYKIYPYGVLITGRNNTFSIDYVHIEIIVF